MRGGMSLENYLIMPIQRLPRYALLLAELNKNTIDAHPDKKNISDALRGVEQALLEIEGQEAKAAIVVQDKRFSKVQTVSLRSILKSEELNGQSSSPLFQPKQSSPARASTAPKKRVSFAFRNSTAPEPVTIGRRSRSHPERKATQTGNNSKEPDTATLLDNAQLAAKMVYSESSQKRVNTEVQQAASPIIAEGTVAEVFDDDSLIVRKLLLLKDKLVVMSVTPTSDVVDIVACLPTTVYTFPLSQLKMERDTFRSDKNGGDEMRFLLRFSDSRKGNIGALFACETEEELNRWLSILLEAIYD